MTNKREQLMKRKYENDGWEVHHGGSPDFLLIRRDGGGKIKDVKFREIKSRFGKLSKKQRVWKEALESIGADFDVVNISKLGVLKLQKKPGESNSLVKSRQQVAEEIFNHMGITGEIRNRAGEILGKVEKTQRITRRMNKGLVAGAIYLSALSYGRCKSPRDIARLTDVDASTVYSSSKRIAEVLGISKIKLNQGDFEVPLKYIEKGARWKEKVMKFFV